MRSAYHLELNFFGYIISISTNNVSIFEQINYIYKHYVIQTIPKTADIDYYFKINSNKNVSYFISDLIKEKAIVVTHGDNINNLKKWESNMTFLPPIMAPYFERKFSFFHGCAIRYLDETIMLLGESRTGKTTLAMNYLNHGAKLISDDLVVIDNANIQVLPFKKPMGIRDTSPFFHNKSVQMAIKNKPDNIPTFFVKELNLTTELIHAEEVKGWCYYESPSSIDKIYFLDRFVPAKISGKEFMMKMLTMNYKSYNPIQVISKIYQNLTSKPVSIPLHQREIV